MPLEGGWRRGRARDTWLLVGAAIAAVSLLLLLVLLLTVSLSKRKCSKRRVLAHHIQQECGTANVAYEGAVDIEVLCGLMNTQFVMSGQNWHIFWQSSLKV